MTTIPVSVGQITIKRRLCFVQDKFVSKVHGQPQIGACLCKDSLQIQARRLFELCTGIHWVRKLWLSTAWLLIAVY